MTTAHIILLKYIDKHFIKGSLSVDYPNNDTIQITDKNGDCMRLTLNLYGDIMDADTRKLLAISDLPHNLDTVGYKLPKDWQELDKR